MCAESELERLDIEMAQFRAKCRREGDSYLAVSDWLLGTFSSCVVVGGSPQCQ